MTLCTLVLQATLVQATLVQATSSWPMLRVVKRPKEEDAPWAPSPSTRTQLTLISDAARDSIWIYGGYDPIQNKILNDVWMYHLATARWSSANLRSQIDPRLYPALTFATGASGSMLWMFGGEMGQPSRFMNNELNVLNTSSKTLRWRTIEAAPNLPWPSPRSRHAMAANESALVIVGGSRDLEDRPQTDVWMFQFSTETWTRLPDIYASSQHFTVAWRNKDLWVSGGHDGKMLWRWDTYPSTHQWAVYQPVFITKPRVPHSLVSLGPDYLIASMGFQYIGRRADDPVYVYSVRDNHWKMILPYVPVDQTTAIKSVLISSPSNPGGTISVVVIHANVSRAFLEASVVDITCASGVGFWPFWCNGSVHNPCDTQPCQRGSCSLPSGNKNHTSEWHPAQFDQSIFEYECVCPIGWGSRYCERIVDCIACVNGRWTTDKGAIHCECYPKWSGAACDLSDDQVTHGNNLLLRYVFLTCVGFLTVLYVAL